MNKLNIELENCYGIRKLKCNFDFTKTSTYSIYAPNGIMKTSLANTFMDLSNARMYGDMQGIIGASLPEINNLELKALTDETEVIKAGEI